MPDDIDYGIVTLGKDKDDESGCEKDIWRKLYPTDTPVCPLVKADIKPSVYIGKDCKLHIGERTEVGIFSKDLNNFNGELENKPVTARGIYVKFTF